MKVILELRTKLNIYVFITDSKPTLVYHLRNVLIGYIYYI